MAELIVTGVGVATADPELRNVGDNGNQVCTVNLAFNRSYRDKNEKWQTEPTFVRVQLWGRRAAKFSEIVGKGQPIYVMGYLKQDNWENKDGQKRVAFSIVARDFQLCQKITKNGDKDEQYQGGEQTKQRPPQNERASEQTSAPAHVLDDDDIPF